VIHFRILDETLCGAEYTEPSRKAAKDGRICNDCVQVMWQEQYRRNTLLKVKVKVDKSEVTQERDDSEDREAGLFLIDFKQS
jgi:hypothetical protein